MWRHTAQSLAKRSSAARLRISAAAPASLRVANYSHGAAAVASDSQENVVHDRWDSLEKNLNFILYDVLSSNELFSTKRYSMHDRDSCDAFMKTTIDLAKKELAPHNSFLDANEPQFVDGTAKVPAIVGKAFAALAESGYMTAYLPPEVGGVQLPYSMAIACGYTLQMACVGISSYALLTHAAAGLLAAHGSEQQKAVYIPPMMNGQYTGTMCLSEPHAGSSLADIITSATPIDEANGVYSITGNKMWISGGDQDFSENIVHLVLARIKGAPAGVKGISLFVVPKYLVNPDGSVGAHNDVSLMGLNHKMGWRGTTNTALAFGENGNCKGFLIGKPNQGLKYMFHMMNEARIGVGVGAAAIGSAGYYHSLEYAMERRQGRKIGAKDPNSPQIPIIEHSDVKRMLLVQKAYTEGAMGLCLYAAKLVDLMECHEPQSKEAKEALLLLELLTPIVKSWPSEWCLEANKWAIQIFGGYGYTRDYPVEQCYRDNRLNMIHEGTAGIQSLDLLGRKVMQENGMGLQLLAKEMLETANSAPSELSEFANTLKECVGVVGTTTKVLLAQGAKGNVDLMTANSHEYLNMFGHVVIAWQWLKQAVAASKQLSSGKSEDSDFLRGKIVTCQFFFRQELPHAMAQAKLLQSLDDSVLRVESSML